MFWPPEQAFLGGFAQIPYRIWSVYILLEQGDVTLFDWGYVAWVFGHLAFILCCCILFYFPIGFLIKLIKRVIVC